MKNEVLKRPTTIGAFVATIALVASACAGTATTDTDRTASDEAEPAALVAPTTLGPNVGVKDHDDGLRHFVVTTDDRPDAGDAEPSMGLSSVDRLFTDDAALPVSVPPQSLRVVAPATPDEESALDRHREATFALLVDDAAGTVSGTPARYVYTEAGLHALDSPADHDMTQDLDGEPDAEGVVAPDGDVAVAERIRDLDDSVEVEIVSPGVIAVAIDGDGDRLSDVAGVAEVHDDVTFGFSDDPLQPFQWALDNTGDPAQANGRAGTPGADIDALSAWNASRGAGVVVAVIDSGVQLDHPDLAGRMHVNDDEVCGNGADDDGNGFVDDCQGWDFGSGDADPTPDGGGDAGHGTHVAGIIAAGDNGVGVVGVAPEALLMPIKIARSDGLISSAALTGAIDYAAANGADVINLSLGTNPGVPRSAVSAIENSIARAVEAGVVVVAATGNHGVDISTRSVWPASFASFYPGVVAVGSSDNNDARSSFSNHGAPLTLFAPGETILSTATGSRHEWRSGTSMATPMVAGAAALVLSAAPLPPGDVRTRLQSTGEQTSAGIRLDAAASVGASTATAVEVSVRGADTLRPDTPTTLGIDVSARNADQATEVRLSMATLDQGSVAAVGGLAARISGPGGVAEVVTDPTGAFPALPAFGDLESGIVFESDLAMPAGEYALVAELLDALGEPVGAPQVVFLSVADPQATTTTTQPPATNPPPSPEPPTSSPTTTSPTVPPTSPPTSDPVGTPTPPSPGTPTTVAPPAPTAPGQPSSPSTPPATSPTTLPAMTPTTPPGTTPPRTTPPGTTPPPPAPPTTEQPSPEPSPTTTTVTTIPPAPGDPTPPTTTPRPEPDTDGRFELTSMTPRAGSTRGGDIVVLHGRFPTNVAVYVWWDELGVVQAHGNTGTELTVATPAVPFETTTDVSVRFRTSSSFELTLRDAFTFVTPSPVATTPPATSPPATNDPAPPTVPAPTPPTTPPGDAGTPPSTTPPTTSPDTAPPTTSPGTVPPSTVPPTTSPPATPPPDTGPTTPSPEPTDPPEANDWTRERGALTLRPPAAGTAIASLTPATWRPACTAASCAASHL